MRRHNQSSFTLVELMTAIAIAAALVVAALFITSSYITWAQQTTDQHNYTVLNDSLTRYKTEGGGVAGLTSGASVSRVLAQMQTPVDWCGQTHQFIQTGVTYPAHSIQATGDGAQFHFYRYNTYNDGTYTPPTGGSGPTYPYGQGVGYMANDGHTDYNFGVQTTTGYLAVKDASGNVTVQDGNDSGDTALGSNASITFWSCLGSGPTPSAPSGTITAIDASTGLHGNFNPMNLTSIDVSGLTGIGNVCVSGNTNLVGTVSALNALYASLPTVPILNGAYLYVNLAGNAASGSNIMILNNKNWGTDAPIDSSGITPQAYPGTGGFVMGNGGDTQPYFLNNDWTSTGYLAYQVQGGSPVFAVCGSLNHTPPCNSVTCWSVNALGAPAGAVTSIILGPSSANLNSLSVSGLTDLCSLDCSAGSLRSLDVSGCASLSYLNCSGNLLGTITTTGCTSLPPPSVNGSTIFDISGNPNPVVVGPHPYP